MQKDNQIAVQRNFFDIEKNQYNLHLIKNPPLHTQIEINIILEKIKKLKIKGQIVDFGAGNGRLTIHLLKNKYSVLAIDVSEKSLRNLQVNAGKVFSSSLQTVSAIPKNKVYELIVGADILHHVNLDQYLPVFYKVLKKGGRVIFSEPGALNPSWYMYLSFASDWKIEKRIINCTISNLKKKFIEHGFKEFKIMGFGLLPRPFFNFSKKVCQLNDLIADWPFIKHFAYRYIIEAIK